MSCGSGMHPKHIYRSSANIGTTKALDRVLARIVRDELDAPSPEPAPGDNEAAAEHQEEHNQANEENP